MQQNTIKVIVQASDSCIEILRYIDQHMNEIKESGIRVRIEKISPEELDEDFLFRLKKKGITRLPVLIDPNDNAYMGVNNIKDLLERNLHPKRVSKKIKNDTGLSLGENPELNDYYQKEMLKCMDNGKFVPEEEEDESQLSSEDMMSKYAKYRTSHPKHRGESTLAEETSSEQPETATLEESSGSGSPDDEMDKKMWDAIVGNSGEAGWN